MFGSCNALALGVDTFISDHAKELSYDHEYAREIWEHEFNAIGEIDEYVAYAISKGIPASRARELALAITSEPSMSVPYHLAFELGMLEPSSYKRKMVHAFTTAVGNLWGFIASEALWRIGEKLLVTKKSSDSAEALLSRATLFIVGLAPILAYRYRVVNRVQGAKEFKLTGIFLYSISVIGIVFLSIRISK